VACFCISPQLVSTAVIYIRAGSRYCICRSPTVVVSDFQSSSVGQDVEFFTRFRRESPLNYRTAFVYNIPWYKYIAVSVRWQTAAVGGHVEMYSVFNTAAIGIIYYYKPRPRWLLFVETSTVSVFVTRSLRSIIISIFYQFRWPTKIFYWISDLKIGVRPRGHVVSFDIWRGSSDWQENLWITVYDGYIIRFITHTLKTPYGDYNCRSL